MFGEQFYPTPEAVIKLMVAPYSGEMWKGGINGRRSDSLCYGLLDKIILDPSAGKGDILNFIKNDLSDYARRDNCDLYCIEIDSDLQSILKENEFSVLGHDFLTYEQDVFFDVILMNPPFKNGDEHLLKAIEIAHDTDIVCLLNAETLLNPHTQKRKFLLEQIKEFGSYEILGSVFDTAERKTNVNVALVRLKVVKEAQSFNFNFSDYEPNKIEFDESFIKNEIARNDMIGNMMIQFEQAKKAHKEYIEAQKKWEHYTSFLIDDSHGKASDFDKPDFSPLKRYNYFNNRIKTKMWRTVISELGLSRYMTASVMHNFELFIQQQANMSFTKENVKQFFEMMILNSTAILEKSIIEVFEMLTSDYYSENRQYQEGWKTNQRYFVNKKVIAPVYVRFGEYASQHSLREYGDKFSLSYHGGHKYADIDKMLCYISGKPYENICTIELALKRQFEAIGTIRTGDKFNCHCYSTFFEIKFYKKGTVHLKFRDNFLWQEFNMRACEGKQWLPDNERTEWENKKKKRREEAKAERMGLVRIGEEKPKKPNKIRKVSKRNSKKNTQLSHDLFALFVPNL